MTEVEKQKIHTLVFDQKKVDVLEYSDIKVVQSYPKGYFEI